MAKISQLPLLDEKIPRELAKSLGLKVAGTLGLLHAGLQLIADRPLHVI
jgi:predicted nucleic acid-binding protein